jgi:ABC-type dipeptide/oligopeptide/nickel transport system permease subunit
MIAEATPIFNTAWWFMVFPGAALLITVLAFNLLGDGLRDALSPRTAPRNRSYNNNQKEATR